MLTYEAKDSVECYETYEWDNTWIDHANDAAGRRRVLYVGDSISVGTRRIATEQASEQVLFDGFGTSKAVDNPYFLDAVRLFAAQLPRCDAILFNSGLHGWHLSDDAAYAEHYERTVAALREHFPTQPLFLVLTTHVADDARAARVRRRNAAVLAIAKKHELPVIDLYSVSLENAALLSPDGVHFTKEGYGILASTILSSVLPTL